MSRRIFANHCHIYPKGHRRNGRVDTLREVMEDLTSKGLRVFASPTENVKIRCKKKAYLENGEVKESG